MKYLSILFCIFLAACNTSQKAYEYGGEPVSRSSKAPVSRSNDLPPSKPGSCYAKCIIVEKQNPKLDTVLVLNADEDVPQDYMRYGIVIDAKEEWVKKKSDNCLSQNPEDCLVWCLQTIPATVIQGTSRIEPGIVNGKEVKYVIQDKVPAGSEQEFTEWREVLCAKDINKFKGDIVSALKSNGYSFNENDDASLKKTLIDYQIKNSLPRGNWNLETLASLGINK